MGGWSLLPDLSRGLVPATEAGVPFLLGGLFLGADELGLFCMFVFVAGIIAVVAIVGYSTKYATLNQCFQKVARAYRGKCELGGIFSGYPRIRFRRNQDDFLIDVEVISRQPYTRLIAPWGDPQFWCEIHPWRLWTSLQSFFTDPGSRIGTPAFQQLFEVQTNDARRATDFLSVNVQRQLERMRWLPPYNGGDLRIAILHGQLAIYRRGVLDEPASLKNFIDVGLELFRLGARWQLASEAEVQILADTAPVLETAPICPICGDPVEVNVVQCASCDTPHHRECWQYNTKCAMYGCGQTDFRRGRSTSPPIRRDTET